MRFIICFDLKSVYSVSSLQSVSICEIRGSKTLFFIRANPWSFLPELLLPELHLAAGLAFERPPARRYHLDAHRRGSEFVVRIG